MHILIIGGTRRCGPYLVEELLARGHTVLCYHRGQHNISFSKGAEHLHGDRRDYPRFKEQMSGVKPDVVIDMMANDDSDVRAIVDAFTGRLQRYICISSFEVYEAFEAAWKHIPSLQAVPIPEDAPKRKDIHLYGEGPRYDKILVERETSLAHERGDFPTTILRWPALYGPRDETPREWYYVKQALDGRKWIAVPAGGQALYARGYFENMAHTAALAAESEAASGQAYNCADTLALSLRQIVQMIGEILDHKWEITPVPRELMPSVPQSQALPCSCDPYDIEPHMLLDLSKIRTELGYRDLVPIRTAMENTVRWLADEKPTVDWLTPSYPDHDEAIRRARQIAGL
ncbi:MAG: NAD-dependent epimerase/dehydratase family protein [Anaerolineae bacterium]|nr:NAD-dependent epimerase/dehydratase family protein [Anaerolineae bacterium]